MATIPSDVKREVDRLRRELNAYIFARAIKGKYYLYQVTTRWDSANRKRKTLAKYLGRVTSDGKFIGKAANRAEAQPAIEERAASLELDETDKKLVTILSMNARADLSLFGRKLGLKPADTYYRVKRLEKRFGIRYVAEIDAEKLGYFTYVAFVKFQGDKPDINDVRAALEKEPRVQLVLAVSGKYDLVIYFLAESSRTLTYYIGDLRDSPAFVDFPAEWYVTQLYVTYGFIHLREVFFDMLKDRVWRRTREAPRPTEGQILNREYVLLKELNENAVVNFTDLDKKYELSANGARHTYYKLLEGGVLKRATIIMESLRPRYNAVVLAEILNQGEFVKTRDDLFMYIVEESKYPVTRFAIASDIELPDGEMLVAPIFGEDDLHNYETELKNRVKGHRVSSLVVTAVVLGKMPYRMFDAAHTSQYDYLLKDKVPIRQLEKIDYQETGKAGKPRQAT